MYQINEMKFWEDLEENPNKNRYKWIEISNIVDFVEKESDCLVPVTK